MLDRSKKLKIVTTGLMLLLAIGMIASIATIPTVNAKIFGGTVVASGGGSGKITDPNNTNNSSTTSTINPLIPAPKPQQPPAGFTQDQINKAKAIISSETDNATKKLKSQVSASNTTTSNTNPLATTQQGDGMFVLRTPIDTVYNVYNTCNSWGYNGCISWKNPSLYIPIKTEIWDDNYQPMQYSSTFYYIYYWNYATNSWSQIPNNNGWSTGYTDNNGNVRLGFKIPYKMYSDKYFIGGYSWSSDWSRVNNMQTVYLTVNWY